MLDITSRYWKGYNRIIDNAISENRKKLPVSHPDYVYYEKHHIVPRCLGGSDNKDNLVFLTAKEHFIAHYLLTKCTSGKVYYQMVKAFDAMGMNGKGQKETRDFTSCRIFEKNRIDAAKAHSEMMKGRKQDPESVKRRARSNTGKKRSPEAIENYKKSTVFKELRFKGKDNHKTKRYKFFDSSDVLRYEIIGGVLEFLRNNDMPENAFITSWRKGGLRLYIDTGISTRTRTDHIDQYKGWYAIREGL